MRSGQMSISSWIDGLPIEPTAYFDPEQQPLPETALRLTRKRKALAEVSWNMALTQPRLQPGRRRGNEQAVQMTRTRHLEPDWN